MNARFLLILCALLLLGVGGFYLAISLSPQPSDRVFSLPSSESPASNRDAASLSLSIADDPVLLEKEIQDTQSDVFEGDIQDLERIIEEP